MARTFVIVAAAGGGSRFGGPQPKQYAALAGAPLIAHTLDRLCAVNAAATVVALAPDDTTYTGVIGVRTGVEAIGCGGMTRAATVRNALAHFRARADRDDWILVHDAARPCVSREALVRLVRELENDAVGGLLAIPVADTLKRADADHEPPRVLRTESRAGLWLAQTPQMFRYHVLSTALSRDAAHPWTDEAQAVEALAATGDCTMPRLVRGDPANVKVTYIADLALAAAIIAAQRTTQ